MKKLPSLFRKKYTQKKLEKKLLSKIFIPADREYVESLFTPAGTKGKKQVPLFAVPADRPFDKKEFKRLKLLAKDIKKQKGRIKLVPFAAVVLFVAAVCVLFTLSKNVLIKKGLQAAGESVFGAKCDIRAVDFRLFDSSLTVMGIDIANKNEPMKNLISFGRITVDFDLTQLLRAKFVADDISVLDIDFNTARTASGALPEKKKKKQEKKAEKAAKTEKTEESAFMKSLSEKKTALNGSLSTMVSDMFSAYNPQAIINSLYEQLQTPKIAQDAEQTLTPIIEKWQGKPEELSAEVQTVADSVQTLVNYDFAAIKDNPVKIKEVVETLNSGIENVKKVSDDATVMMGELQADFADVQTLSASIQAAIMHDTDFAKNEISKITSFRLSDGISFFSDLFDSALYSLLGNYYPYAKLAIDKLTEMKANGGSSEKQKKEKKEKAAKTATGRLAGRDVYYKKDTVPKFWLKNAASTGEYFNARLTNVSSDQDKLGVPAEGSFSVLVQGITHNSDFSVDLRSYSQEPLVALNYNADNFLFDLASDVFGGGAGVPSFNSKLNVSGTAKAWDTGAFTVGGSGFFKQLAITAEPFEPEYAYDIYKNVLAGITSINADADISFSEDDGLKLALVTDADKIFVSAITAEMNRQLDAIKASAQEEITKKIQELSQDALGDLGQLDEIKALAEGSFTDSQSLKKQLEAKKTEAENYLKEQATNAVTNTITNAATDALKNLPGGNSEESDSAVNDAMGRLKKLF